MSPAVQDERTPTPEYKRGDTIWCLFGDGFSNDSGRRRWFFWLRDSDEAVEGRVRDVLDDGMLVVEYWFVDGAVSRDWFTAEQTRKQIRPRSVESSS